MVDVDFLACVHGLARNAFNEFGAVPMIAVRGDGYRDGALVVDDAFDGVDAGLHGGAGDAVERRGQVVGILQVKVGGVAQALVHVRCLERYPRRQHRPFPCGQRADGLLVPGTGVVSLLGVALRTLHFLLLVAIVGEPGQVRARELSGGVVGQHAALGGSQVGERPAVLGLGLVEHRPYHAPLAQVEGFGKEVVRERSCHAACEGVAQVGQVERRCLDVGFPVQVSQVVRIDVGGRQLNGRTLGCGAVVRLRRVGRKGCAGRQSTNQGR